MASTAWCASYQRRVAGEADDLINIPATLVHIGHSQTAERCDDPDIGVAIIGRRASDCVGPRPSRPTMIALNRPARRFAIVSGTWDHCKAALSKIQGRFCEWSHSESGCAHILHRELTRQP